MENKNKKADKISNSDMTINDNTRAQHESKYDSHSEQMPHQKTVVNSNSNPDRISNDNRDTTIKKDDDENDLDDDGSEKNVSQVN